MCVTLRSVGQGDVRLSVGKMSRAIPVTIRSFIFPLEERNPKCR